MLLAEHLPVDIISVDSAQVYRGMDIGTAKPTLAERQLVPHHLVDIVDPSIPYSAAIFYSDALHLMAKTTAAGRIPLLVGGTMLYFRALLYGLAELPPANQEVRQGLEATAADKGWPHLHFRLAQIDPEAAARIHPNDGQRLSRALEIFFVSGKRVSELLGAQKERDLPYRLFQFALAPPDRSQLRQLIVERFSQMLRHGFEHEVARLMGRGDLNLDLPAMRSVGYRQMWCYLAGEIDYETMVHQSVCATWQLAKRQMTWLRGWQNIRWIEGNQLTKALQYILQGLNSVSSELAGPAVF